jgi:hypothetical protein
MKRFMIFDFWVNVLLIIGFTIIGLIKKDVTFLYGYFTVGGWQVISMIMHAVNKQTISISNIRKSYHWITVFSIAGMFTIVFFYVLLYIAPFMAIFYTSLCGFEVFAKVKRPLDQLK